MNTGRAFKAASPAGGGKKAADVSKEGDVGSVFKRTPAVILDVLKLMAGTQQSRWPINVRPMTHGRIREVC